MKASNLFSVGTVVTTKHGNKAIVRAVSVVVLGDKRRDNMSSYTLELSDGSVMLLDFIDAHNTAGGYLRAV